MSNQDPQWGTMGGGPAKAPKFLTDQVKNLQNLKASLERVEGLKLAEIAELQAKLLRLKHGGGL